MDTILSLFGTYYGLDWATVFSGLCASYAFSSHKMRAGFMFGLMACVCAFCVAYMSHQIGFIVYNIMLFFINMRGILKGDRRGMFDRRASSREDAPAPVPAQ